MKVYVFYNPNKKATICNIHDYVHDDDAKLLQVIEAERTHESLPETWEGPGIQVGEVFRSNHVAENLKRVK